MKIESKEREGGGWGFVDTRCINKATLSGLSSNKTLGISLHIRRIDMYAEFTEPP